MEVDAVHGIDLIDGEGAVVPTGRDITFGIEAVAVVVGEASGKDGDDGGFDGNCLTVFAFGAGEAEGELGGAGYIHVVGGDLSEENGSSWELRAVGELNFFGEGGAEFIAGLYFAGDD